jgi:mannobiose 2-epimerase
MIPKVELNKLRAELDAELENILNYWIKNTVDNQHGGFVGRIDDTESVHHQAPKGSVLNARILWSFSAAYQIKPNEPYLKMAERAFQFIKDHFIDQQFGGVYWSVDYLGNPLDTKKQVYAIAFTIYALSEFYSASQNEEARQLAIELYHLLVVRSFDAEKTGYLEAFTRDWQSIDDLRLSTKDANEKKTMNTHLHVLEAYANLYKIWPDEGLKDQLTILIHNFLDHIIDLQNHHLVLFFDEDWNRRSDTVSYGHDIEASWLLLEAAEIIGNEQLITRLKKTAIEIADAAAEGLDHDGGLWYEYEPADNHLIRQKHWWVQAEAVVGFFNAWQVSSDQKYLDIATQNWEFIKQHILDRQNGEWVWGVDAHGLLMPGEDKVGIWKCPYHNSRSCIELIKRIN